jgi:hypothetical protein
MRRIKCHLQQLVSDESTTVRTKNKTVAATTAACVFIICSAALHPTHLLDPVAHPRSCTVVLGCQRLCQRCLQHVQVLDLINGGEQRRQRAWLLRDAGIDVVASGLRAIAVNGREQSSWPTRAGPHTLVISWRIVSK